MALNSGNLSFKFREDECLLRFPAVAKLRWVAGRGVKTKEINDQSARVTRYYQIKDCIGSII